MGRYSGIKMTKLTHYIIKNFNPNIKMNVNFAQIINYIPNHVYLPGVDLQSYYDLAKNLNMDGTTFTTILKENYDRLVQIREKYGLRSIQLTLDLIMAYFINTCKSEDKEYCGRIRQLTGVSKAKKGWL